MVRAFVISAALATTGLLAEAGAGHQAVVRLTITVTMVDDAGAATAVARHVLLVSDSPPSTVPHRLVTDAQGSAGINLRPGRYIVESERPIGFRGQAFRWMQVVDVAAEGVTALALNTSNASVGPLTDAATPAGSDSPDVFDPSDLLRRWEDSVVELWTPTAHASGVVVDRRGLIVTTQRAIGDATSIEVQLAADTKVEGRVVVSDAGRDVALVRIDAATVATVDPLPLDCAGPAMPLVDAQEVFSLGVRLRGPRDTDVGAVRHVSSQRVVADFGPGRLSPGGPVFADDGRVVGLTSIADADEEDVRGDVPIVGIAGACAAIGTLAGAPDEAAPPDRRLPVEAPTAVPGAVLELAVARRAGSLLPYEMSSSDFDIRFLTPIHVYAGLYGSRSPAMDFSNWSDYVRQLPPVLLVRVTPKQSESFWMKLARGAAWTQGVSLPPIGRFEPGVARLRAFCGENEITPVHAFKLVTRISETAAVHEGLGVFTPDALGPHCGAVRLMVSSEKNPDEAVTMKVDPTVIRRIHEDFALLDIGGR